MTAALPLPSCLTFLLALLMAAPASAQDARNATCRDGVETVLRKALAGHADTRRAASGTRLQLDCVAVPGDLKGAMHAIGSFRDDATRSYNEGGEGEGYAFILATLDGEGRLRHHVVATAIEDATTLFLGGEFTLDTTFHDLAPSGGVIGVAVSQTAPGASAPDSRSGDEFALFVPEGRGFRRVLGLARYRQEAIEGCVNVQCRGARWINTAATLAPSARTEDGWRSIVMRLDVEEFAVEPAVALSSPTSTTVTLFHRDGAYRLDDGATPPGSEYFGLVPW
jgi:hypothetical protein